jgi:hypothetical protein
MVTTTRGAVATLLFVVQLATGPVSAQASIDVYELADYRLTPEVFERFVQASRRIADITREDATFTFVPLFTKELVRDGDAVAEAAALVSRLEHHPSLAAALAAADITPREYAKFAITLIVAHLAYGFLTSGVLPRVPAGAPTNNVEFIKTHESEVTVVLARLGIRD